MIGMPRRVLLVSYHYPPMGGSGVQRALKLSRYLPDCGWRPVVLCAGHERAALRDDSLTGEIPPAVEVVRHRGWEPAGLARSIASAWSARGASNRSHLEQRLYWRLQSRLPLRWIPETEWLWAMSARRVALRLARDRALEAIVTTGGPFTVFEVGLYLKRRCDIPWIADWRDPLIGNFAYAPTTPRIDAYWRRLEHLTVRSADRHIVTCPEHRADLLRRHPMLPESRVETITNGYDPADFAGPFPPPAAASAMDEGSFRIAHVGALYKQQSIAPLLAALRLWRARRADIRGVVRLVLCGSLSSEQRSVLRDTDAEFVETRGYVDHAAAVAAMRSADLLYLTAPNCPGGRLCIPAKTFEYLASARPIVAAIPAGTWLHDLLRRCDGVELVSAESAELLAAALERCHAAWQCGAAPTCDRTEQLNGLRRDVLAARYAESLNQLVAPNARREHLHSVEAAAFDGHWEEAA